MKINPKYSEPCPCMNCVCVPVCKHRPYSNLNRLCLLVNNYITAPHADKSYRIRVVRHVLQPTEWSGVYQYINGVTV